MSDLNSWFVSKSQEYQLNKKVDLSILKDLIYRLSIKPPKKIISIAGTNGKGSTGFLINQILSKKYKVGLYSSPHFIDPNERIIINSSKISDASIKDSFNLVEKINKNELNFYQLFSLAAFNIFSQSDLDIWVLEAGIGGRLDPINCFDADISIITNIAFDHENILGNNLEKIALEKAGIIRKDKFLLFGEDPLPDSIKEKVVNLNTKLLKNKKDFFLVEKDNKYEWNGINIGKSEIHPNSLALALQAIYLIDKNVPVKSLNLNEHPGMKGRCHLIGNKYLIDVAHNNNASLNLKDFIIKNKLSRNKIFAIFHCSKDKDILKIAEPLDDLVSFWSIPIINNKRLYPEKFIAKTLLKKLGAEVKVSNSISDSINYLNKEDSESLILIFGSFYLAGEFYKVRSDLNV